MKIAVGLSGGVDSAVSAAILKRQGHEVVGVFMKNWSNDYGIEGDCPWQQDQDDARAVADYLGITFLTYNFELQYRKKVIEYFFAEYKAGRTPNPDILCNSEIKFNVFLNKALQELGVDKIATGHYARIIKDENGYHLLKGIDENKDQSYFLCRLTQEELSKVEFPIGHLKKSDVRKLAEEIGLPNAKKKDSQGICFVGKINIKKFLEKELGMKPGKIVDVDSTKILGEHKGLWFYTIGQREGIGLAGGPWYVASKDLHSNTLFVAKGGNNPALFKSKVILKDVNFLIPSFEKNVEYSFVAEVSLRYRQKPSKALISFSPVSDNNNSKMELTFFEPQRAVTEGQFGCIYMEDKLVCSGVISN